MTKRVVQTTRQLLLPLLSIILPSMILHGTEYYVAHHGDDAANGTSEATAFATVQRGVDALQPGDVLTILPGEYVGSIRRDGIGGPDADTIIRAAIPGTVVIRGDVPISGFKPLEGFLFIYVADLQTDGTVRAVNEWETLSILSNSIDCQSLEFIPGTFFHDKEAGKLYVSTQDLTPPTQRTYTASVNDGHGIYLSNAKRVIIEGLGITGFNTDRMVPGKDGTYGAVWGIFVYNGTSCVIRNCRAWMNSQGMGLSSVAERAGNNTITHCVAWANRSDYGNGDRGGFTIHGDRLGRHDVIQHCTSFLNAGHGINIYLTDNQPQLSPDTRNRLLHNVAWGNSPLDYKIKTGYENSHTVEYCAGPGRWFGIRGRASHCLIGTNDPDYPADNIVLAGHPDLDWNLQFADPVNHDYRLQSDSVLRGSGPDGRDPGPYPYSGNVYFVSANGDDRAAGQSLQTAWRTLGHALNNIRRGDTLYLEPGTYAADGSFALKGSSAEPIVIRSRGEGEAELIGSITLSGKHVQFERVRFGNSLHLADFNNVQFKSCSFLPRTGPGLQLTDCSSVSVVHCKFLSVASAAIDLNNTKNLFVQGSVFDNSNLPAYSLAGNSSILYRDYNIYANGELVLLRDGTVHGIDANKPGSDYYSYAVNTGQPPRSYSSAHGWQPGPFREQPPEPTPLLVTRPQLHSVTPHSVNLEWWSAAPIEYTLTLSPVANPGKLLTKPFMGHRYASLSLTDLQPDTEYVLRIEPNQPFAVWGENSSGNVTSIEYTFRTSETYARDAATFYVSPDGDDNADGLTPDSAWRSVKAAASRLQPGDTLLLLEGTYPESVWMRVSGEAGRPITIASAPGQKVVFNGLSRTLSDAFVLSAKSHIHLDGMYFIGYADGSGHLPWSGRTSANGVINVYGGESIHISRCFVNGLGQGTSPGLVQAMLTADLLVENSVVASNMSGAIAVTGSSDTLVRNCVFFRPYISALCEIMNEPDQPFTVENSIITDNLIIKKHQPLICIGMAESFHETNNCYYLRQPEADKKLFLFYGAIEYDRAAIVYGGIAFGFSTRMFEKMELLTFDQYKERVNPDTTSFIANPKFAGTLDLNPTDSSGDPVFFPDLLAGNPNLDFPDLFATDPVLMARDIGLQPTAFADFHFASND